MVRVPFRGTRARTPADLEDEETRALVAGAANKVIAFDLGIAEATVKAHMTALMRKLNVHNRTQAAIAAQSLVQGLRSAAR